MRFQGRLLLNFFIGIFLVFLFSSACSLGGPEPDTNVAWQDEILIASECGLDGLPCCPEKDQPCLYGQVCCVDPNNPGRSKCLEECSCGGFKQFCCATGEACGAGLACRLGECALCGQEGAACCDDGGECFGQLACHNDRCAVCGLAGNPCCAQETACAGMGAPDATRTECQNGLCAYCGFEAMIACSGNPACNQSHLLNNNKCLGCGGYNQPCCAGDGEGRERCGTGLFCNLGFCLRET